MTKMTKINMLMVAIKLVSSSHNKPETDLKMEFSTDILLIPIMISIFNH